MTEPRLILSPTFSLPLDAVTDTFGLLAKRRAGKTNAAVAMAEEMFANGLPWVAIDPVGSWWGIRAAGEGGPGLPVLVFGGEHGDLPLEPTSGRMVADLVVDQNLTCVLDISLMDEEDELPRFVADFLGQLYRRNRDPRHLFIEEAEVILPQTVTKSLTSMFKAGNKIIKLGGGRGLGVTLITQRSASLNKNALTQVEILIALRTTAPTDQAAILAWVKHHEMGAEAVSALAGLVDGEAFVINAQAADSVQRVQFRRRHTYDSGATPKVGQEVRPPADLASIDLGALRDAMAATIERAEADDPELLRGRIAELEDQLFAVAHAGMKGGDTERTRIAELEQQLIVAQEVLQLQAREHAEALLKYVTEHLDRASELAESVGLLQDSLRMSLQSVQQQQGDQEFKDQMVSELGTRIRTIASNLVIPRSAVGLDPEPGSERPGKPVGPSVAALPPASADSSLSKPQRAILTVLAQHGDRTKKQIAVLSGYSVTSGAFASALAALRAQELIGTNDTRQLEITPEGRRRIGTVEPLPTGKDLLRYWQTKLNKPEGAVLELLTQVYPRPMSKAEIASHTGYSYTSGAFASALAKLRGLELIDGTGQSMRATQELQ